MKKFESKKKLFTKASHLIFRYIGVGTGAFGVLCACTVISIQDDQLMRDRQSGNLDAVSYIERQWSPYFLPLMMSSAVELRTIIGQLRHDLDGAGQAAGRRVSKVSPWSFVITGEGSIASVEDPSQVGRVHVSIPKVGKIELLTGPVLVSTAVRDSLPSIRFDDFSDQMSFALVNKALNEKVYKENQEVVQHLQPGAHIRFVGALKMPSAEAPLVVIPIQIELLSGIGS